MCIRDRGHPELIIRNYRPISFKGHSDALRYAQRTKFINKIFNKKLCDLNFEKLEGIQQGLKTFEGLSLKQIAFALTDLHSINMISGCTNHCLHCYANAQPVSYTHLDVYKRQVCRSDFNGCLVRINICAFNLSAWYNENSFCNEQR